MVSYKALNTNQKNNIQYGKRLFEHACSYFVLLVQILDFFSILGVEQTSKEI